MLATVPEFDHFDMTLTAIPRPSPPRYAAGRPKRMPSTAGAKA